MIELRGRSKADLVGIIRDLEKQLDEERRFHSDLVPRAGAMTLNLKDRTVIAGDRTIPLTNTLFALLDLLMRARGESVDPETIRRTLLLGPATHTVPVAISRLRDALGPWSIYVVNSRNKGYAVVPPESEVLK